MSEPEPDLACTDCKEYRAAHAAEMAALRERVKLAWKCGNCGSGEFVCHNCHPVEIELTAAHKAVQDATQAAYREAAAQELLEAAEAVWHRWGSHDPRLVERLKAAAKAFRARARALDEPGGQGPPLPGDGT